MWLFPKGRININTDDNFSILKYFCPQLLESSEYSISGKSCSTLGGIAGGESWESLSGSPSHRLWGPVVFPVSTFSWEPEPPPRPLCGRSSEQAEREEPPTCAGSRGDPKTLLCTPQLAREGGSRGHTSSASAPTLTVTAGEDPRASPVVSVSKNPPGLASLACGRAGKGREF